MPLPETLRTMVHARLSRTRILLKVIILAAPMWTAIPPCVAQTPSEGFNNVLRTQAALTPDELAALRQGRAVVKLLPAADKRELAVCGLLRLPGTPAPSLTALKVSLTQQGNQVMREGGRLGTPPSLEDLQSLSLGDRDLDEMSRCTAGGCGLKMSAAMNERLRTEVDWAAPDHRLRATRLFKLMLFDYLRDYLARGDAALVENGNGAGAVRPDEEQRSLINSLPYLKDSAPEFADYLQGFPRSELPGVENSLHWSKLKFGLRPVFVITHTATYTRRHGDARQILIATKQLYANRYLDSSASLTLLTDVPLGDGGSETYLLYASRTRADFFGGPFGKIKRRLVEGQVLDGLSAVLQRTRQNAEIQLLNQSGDTSRGGEEEAGPRPWVHSLLDGAGFILCVLLIALIILLMRHGRRGASRAALKF